jgi:ribosomal-protein-serine acetyltransferase
MSPCRIAERFGFTFEGTLRKRNFERGQRVDLLIWGLLRDEWVGFESHRDA